MNYKMIAYTLGWVIKIEAVSMILPVICALLLGEQKMISVFVICIATAFFAGTFLSFKKPKHQAMYAREGFIAVALSWLCISFFGALPLFG